MAGDYRSKVSIATKFICRLRGRLEYRGKRQNRLAHFKRCDAVECIERHIGLRPLKHSCGLKQNVHVITFCRRYSSIQRVGIRLPAARRQITS